MTETERIDTATVEAQLLDLIERLDRSAQVARDKGWRSDSWRLKGKSEGVRLALSCIREAPSR